MKEATMVQNAAYYIFTQADDGSFEAYPVDSQYRFTPVINYRTLTADEAEEEFSLRNKTINYFSLMVKKRLTDTEEKPGEEEIAIPKVKSKVDKLVRCSMFISRTNVVCVRSVHSKKWTTCSGLMKTAMNNVLLPTLFKVVNNIVQHCYT